MGGREFTVKARILADTKDAERNTRALAKAEEELTKRLADVKAKFDAGEISATRFAKAQAGIARETKRVEAALKGTGDSAAKATSGLEGTLSKLLGFGSAAAVFATLKNAITGIAQNMTVSEAATTRFTDALDDLKTSLADAVVEGEPATNALAFAMDKLATKAETVGQKARVAMQFLRDEVPGLEAASKAVEVAFGLSGAAVDEFTAKAEKVSEFWKRGAAEAEIFSTAVAGLEQVLAKTGQTLGDEVAVAEANHLESVRQLNAAYDARLITSEKHQTILEALELGISGQAAVTTETTQATDAATGATARWSSALHALIEDSSFVNLEVGKMRSTYKGVREQVLLAAAAFDELAAAQGRAAAVSAAVNAGGLLSSDGRRVGIRGGSRLTTGPGLTGITSRRTTG